GPIVIALMNRRDAHFRRARLVPRDICAVKNGHIAAAPGTPVKEPADRRIRPGWDNHLEKAAVDRKENILKPELRQRRAMTDVEPENSAERPLGLTDIMGREADLPQADIIF